MDLPPAPSFDPALLDMENMTADKWYALLYNKIVQQEDIFVGDFKKKVIEMINTCMNKPNTTIESLKQDITNSINESQFEFEHQKFIDGIVGGAYEYLCQFIIKNSMENIKRTQCALNCFSLTNNLNCGAIKPCCNENILLQGSSKLSQIQCSTESNNNTNDTDKVIQSYVFNNNDPNSMLMVERENIKNTTVNKIETASFHNYRETLQINNLSIESTNNTLFNNILTNNNENTADSSVNIEDDDNTTQSIMSLALKIQETSFRDDEVDGFEANEINNDNTSTNNDNICTNDDNTCTNNDNICTNDDNTCTNNDNICTNNDNICTNNDIICNNNDNILCTNNDNLCTDNDNICIDNEIQITEDLVEQNEDQNTDPLKSEEEYKMKNSLKILQSLVNIEHDKLEVQKSLTTNEIQLNNEKNEINVYKSSKNTIIKKKKSRKSQENIHKEEEEWLPSNARQKNHSSKNRTKINKGKNHKNKAPKKNRKLKTQKTLNNSSTSNSNCSVKIQNGQSTLLTMKESLVSSCTKKNETVVSTVKNTKSLDTICSTETQMTYLNVKYCPPTNELLELDDFENIPHSEKKKCLRKVKNSDMLPNKTCPIASTSGNNKKDVENLKNKSSSSSSSTMKISDYKKLYEKDRKSLFSPDIIIKNISSKPSKDLTNVLHIKKEYNSIQKKEEPEKKPKPAVCKVENNNKTSNKRKKSTKNNTDEVKITENCSKLIHDSKSKSNHASSTKYKRIKLVKNDKRAKTNTVSNTNNKSNTIDISENKASGNNNTLGSQKLNRTMKMENNMSGESTSKHQQLNEVNVLENKESDKNTLESETVPEWLRRLYVIHNIKPLYVIINPNITY